MRKTAGEMVGQWALPDRLPVGDEVFPIRPDFRAVLKVLEALNEERLPLFARWRRALFLFYRRPVPERLRRQAMEQLCDFITCGQPGQPGPKLLDWSADAQLIAAEINAVAGKEVRQERFVHWWTFLGWFHAIGPGVLAETVAIRDKLRRGKKLTPQQRQWYLKNPERFRMPESEAQRQEKQYLEELLKGGTHGKTA